MPLSLPNAKLDSWLGSPDQLIICLAFSGALLQWNSCGCLSVLLDSTTIFLVMSQESQVSNLSHACALSAKTPSGSQSGQTLPCCLKSASGRNPPFKNKDPNMQQPNKDTKAKKTTNFEVPSHVCACVCVCKCAERRGSYFTNKLQPSP